MYHRTYVRYAHPVIEEVNVVDEQVGRETGAVPEEFAAQMGEAVESEHNTGALPALPESAYPPGATPIEPDEA